MAKSAVARVSQTAAEPLSVHAQRLDALARIAVKVGLNVAKGQEVVMTAPVEGADLARLIATHAYRAGASLVTTLYDDEALSLLRYQHAPDASFDAAAGWLYDGMAKAYANGAARLAIRGGNPSLLAGQSPDKVSRANRAMSKAYQPALEKITGFDINWTIVPYASPAWAKAVFPNASEKTATAKLWDALFSSTRADTPDPIAAWKSHNKELARRTKLLHARRFASALRKR